MQIDFKGNTEVSACGRSGGLMRELNNLMHHAGGHPGYPMMIPSIVWGAKGGGGGQGKIEYSWSLYATDTRESLMGHLAAYTPC